MVYSALSDDSSTVSQFTRRKEIIITTAGTSTPTDYQVKLTITFEPGMQADFDDIRFNTKAGAYIDYWIESYVASTSAIVWVKLPDAITDGNVDTTHMYYCNASLSDGGNIEDTFVFGDNFNTLDWVGKWQSADQGKYTIVSNTLQMENATLTTRINSQASYSGPIIIEASIKGTNSSGYTYLSFNETQGTWNSKDWARLAWTNDEYYSEIGDVSSNTATTPSLTTFYRFKYILPSSGDSTWNIYNDGVLDHTQSDTPTYRTALVGMIQQSENYGYVDWIYIRKYIANEPTLSYGTAEHQRRTPQFIG